MNKYQSLLTIAIPTWNRAKYLKLTLDQLSRESQSLKYNELEVLISDNCSSDDTETIARAICNENQNFNYYRSDINKGGDFNIAKSFQLASGKYVLILGDDDIIVDGGLKTIIDFLKTYECGVVCLKPFGYELDFRAELPNYPGSFIVVEEFNQILLRVGQYITLISSLIINKSVIQDIDPFQFIGVNLVQVHLALSAATRFKRSAFYNKYIIACKRNNSGGYNFFEVFVTNLGLILDSYSKNCLSPEIVYRFENKLIISYFPFYLLKQMLSGQLNTEETKSIFEDRFKDRLAYKIWIQPILKMYKPFALIWCVFAVLFGRIAYGDLNRGLSFLFDKLKFALINK
jgi:glycosyltransferase involved in cell wall biosynthesis